MAGILPVPGIPTGPTTAPSNGSMVGGLERVNGETPRRASLRTDGE